MEARPNQPSFPLSSPDGALAAAVAICRDGLNATAVLCRMPDWRVMVNGALARLAGAGPSGEEFRPLEQVWPGCWSQVRASAEAAWQGQAVSFDLSGMACRLVPVREGAEVVGLFLSSVPAAGPRSCPDEAAMAEAVRANQQKSRFFAAASHDLRQPFQAMRLFMGALQGQLKDARAHQIAEKLSQSMEAGENLLNSFLDVSILDAGGITAKLERFELAPMVAGVVEEFRLQAEAKGLRLRTRLRPVRVTADPLLLTRILRNFLNNAIHYTRRGGILVGIRLRQGRALLQVWDTGFGIPRNDLSRIFEEFYQIENPERDRKRGLGLGLSIVRRLAELLEAALEVRSRLGRGSMFAVCLPLAADADGPGCVLPRLRPHIGGRTVLVVDDDELVLAALQTALEALGCQVLAASDMAAVFAALDRREDGPEVMICDLRLRGGLSGFQVIDRVRALYRRAVPAVVLTGEAGGTDMLAEARRRGVALIRKPVDVRVLAAALEEATAGEG